MLLAQAGGAEASNHVERQLRVRELTTEGVPYPQLVVDGAGVLVSANQAARQMFELPPADLGRSLKDLELSYRPVDLRTPLDRVGPERRPASAQIAEITRGDA